MSNGWTQTGRVLAAAFLATTVVAGHASAYTVITRDGHRFESRTKPEVRGLQAFFRLEPHGQLAVILEEKIDWTRTAAANPEPGVLAIPAGATLVEAERSPALDSNAPIEMKITGRPAAPPAQPAAPAPATKAAHAQEAILKLQKEYAGILKLRDQTAQEKLALEAELAGLQSRSSDHAGADNAGVKRIRELQDMIGQASSSLARFEGRMNEIRTDVVQLGGTID